MIALRVPSILREVLELQPRLITCNGRDGGESLRILVQATEFRERVGVQRHVHGQTEMAAPYGSSAQGFNAVVGDIVADEGRIGAIRLEDSLARQTQRGEIQVSHCIRSMFESNSRGTTNHKKQHKNSLVIINTFSIAQLGFWGSLISKMMQGRTLVSHV